MNSLIKFIKIPQNFMRLSSYSTSSSIHNVEAWNVLSNDEIDFEVCEKNFQNDVNGKVQFL